MNASVNAPYVGCTLAISVERFTHNEDGDMLPCEVGGTPAIAVEGGWTELLLSPDEARELAAALLSAADFTTATAA